MSWPGSSVGRALSRHLNDRLQVRIPRTSKLSLLLASVVLAAALVAALALPMAVLGAINLTIGSRWRVALRRAQLAGRCLAHYLMEGATAGRPVTLVSSLPGLSTCGHASSYCGTPGGLASVAAAGPVRAAAALTRRPCPSLPSEPQPAPSSQSQPP